jgi:hypothetical protein
MSDFSNWIRRERELPDTDPERADSVEVRPRRSFRHRSSSGSNKRPLDPFGTVPIAKQLVDVKVDASGTGRPTSHVHRYAEAAGTGAHRQKLPGNSSPRSPPSDGDFSFPVSAPQLASDGTRPRRTPNARVRRAGARTNMINVAREHPPFISAADCWRIAALQRFGDSGPHPSAIARIAERAMAS